MTSATVHMALVRFGFLVALVSLAAGCMPADPIATADAGRDSDTGGDAAKSVTYTKDVQPIFRAKCSPCHDGEDLGHHNIATNYTDALKSIESVDSFGCWNDTEQTMPKKVGECALILVMNGRMPSGAGCGNEMPLEPDKCLSSDQKAVLAAWIAAGMPQ